MNKIKSTNIIILSLQILSIVLLFSNGVYEITWHHWAGVSTAQGSFYSRFLNFSEGKILGVVFLSTLAIMIIALIVQIVQKKSFKMVSLIALIQPILFIIYSTVFDITMLDGDMRTYGAGTFYYLIIVIFIIITVLAFASNFIRKNAQEGQQKVQTVITQEIPQSNADELKKYKDLLDSGVITEEEFEVKKKQLLGL